jgi:hypothetical protein
MVDAFAFAFTAALNPTLLAATMVMLFAAYPRRLMLGFVLGAYTISISIGLVIVFALHQSGAVETTQHTLSPAADVVLGLLFVLVAAVIHSDGDVRLRARRHARAEPKETPRWKQALDRGSPRAAYVVGILLTLPGASYLLGMSRIAKSGEAAAVQALAVVAFCVIMLLLIELPLLGYWISPEATQRRVERFTAWVHANGRAIVTRAALIIGGLLVLRGVVTLVGQ